MFKDINILRRVWNQVPNSYRYKLLILFLLIILSSLAEIISISAVIPFLTILTKPNLILANSHFNFLKYKNLDITFSITIIFAFLNLLSAIIKILTIYFQTKISFDLGKEFSSEVYRKTLYQPYSIHTLRNTSEIISGITSKASNVTYFFIMPFLTIVSSVFILLSFTIALLILNPKIVIIVLIGFTSIYFSIISLFKKRIKSDSKIISEQSNNQIKILQEGLGGIRDVLLDGTQESYVNIYKISDDKYRKAQSNVVIFSNVPKPAVEALAITFIAILAYHLTSQANSSVINAVPMLGAMALGAQRMLPIAQQIYQSWTLIQSNIVMLDDTLNLIEQPVNNFHPSFKQDIIYFKKQIEFRNVTFKYFENNPEILSNLNLIINKGDTIGIIGTTGSGKSTFLDLLMYLLVPTNGKIFVDNNEININNYRSWQLKIAHVPQSIFLMDSTITENIAFGVKKEDIKMDLVIESAKKAKLFETIINLPNKFNTIVGERGIRLSGGQRQRIGIARALYKKAEILIFDEATSALDSNTESQVMQAIDLLDEKLTIIIVAHRITTLKNCNKIIELDQGKIKRTGDYNQLFGNHF
jgi:ABC-type multidrug transport system fused ATPase/permease subunit